jgi:hypothetical protein
MTDEEARRKRAERLRKRIERLRSGDGEDEKPRSPREFSDRKAREEIERRRRRS